MSELSDKIRSEFKKADDERDALMNAETGRIQAEAGTGRRPSDHYQRSWRSLDVWR